MGSVSSLITCLAFHNVLLLLEHSWIIRTDIEYKYSLGLTWDSPYDTVLVTTPHPTFTFTNRLNGWLWALDSAPKSICIGHAKIECIDPSEPADYCAMLHLIVYASLQNSESPRS